MSDQERILILSNSPKGNRLAEYLRKRQEDVILWEKSLSLEEIEQINPFFVISHGYSKIIKPDIINWGKDKIINTHSALLPVNRGSYANFWSFVYKTVKGATIHRVDSGIDTGEILLQKELTFDIKHESFFSTYQVVEETIFNLLIEHWEELKYNKIQSYKQDDKKATYHSLKKFRELKKIISFEWTDNIAKFLEDNEKILNTFCMKYAED